MIHSENVNRLLSQVRTPIDGYRALASSIIIQAVDDRRKARLRGDFYAIQSIDRFFMSDLFTLFTRGKVEGAYLIRKLNAEKPSELRQYLAVAEK